MKFLQNCRNLILQFFALQELKVDKQYNLLKPLAMWSHDNSRYQSEKKVQREVANTGGSNYRGLVKVKT